MIRHPLLRALVVTAVLGVPLASAPGEVRMIAVEGEGAKYWPRWRGPSGQGLVAAGAYTDTWSATTHVQWKAPVPGRGNSSPVVWGDRIFLTTAREEGRRLSMLAFSRGDGKPLWETFIPQEGTEQVHQKNGYASATPATDGQRVYASFGRHGLAAFDFSGTLAWHRGFGVIDNYHGPAGSPVLYKDRIFLYPVQNPTTNQTAFVESALRDALGRLCPVCAGSGEVPDVHLAVSNLKKLAGRRLDRVTAAQLKALVRLGRQLLATDLELGPSAEDGELEFRLARSNELLLAGRIPRGHSELTLAH